MKFPTRRRKEPDGFASALPQRIPPNLKPSNGRSRGPDGKGLGKDQEREEDHVTGRAGHASRRRALEAPGRRLRQLLGEYHRTRSDTGKDRTYRRGTRPRTRNRRRFRTIPSEDRCCVQRDVALSVVPTSPIGTTPVEPERTPILHACRHAVRGRDPSPQ